MKVVTQAGRASSCNYLLSHKSGKVKDIETTPDHYGVIDLEGDIMVHANHFVHFDMIPFEKRPKDKLENSKFRENRFKQLVTGGKGKLSLEKLKECLTDHEHYPRAVCAHAEGNPWNIATIASIIAQPSNGLMHVSYGQGCKNEYVTYSL
jgi:isopenicillin-N N-acyltransferase-like protein